MKKVSVIVPVYNVERYIGRCVRSLMEQTLSDVEYIFVDDCSPDCSIGILKDMIGRYGEKSCTIISHEENKGLPAARNTGLAAASGKYIFHCDSDDWVEPDMLQVLYDKAEAEGADIVWCDWFLSFSERERYMKQPGYSSPYAALKGMLSGRMKYNVWNKLIRRDLYLSGKVRFPEGYGMGEDLTVIRLFTYAGKVAYVNRAFYHYVQQNAGAFSRNYTDKRLAELKHNADETISFLNGKFGNALDKEIAFFKLDMKFPFLIGDDKNRYILWQTWYPEANRYIFADKEVSVARRMLQFFADKGMFALVWLYYRCVHRLVYGVIFR